MIKYLRRFPTTLDIELLYFLSNVWWLIVFISPPGYFSGITYDRAIYYLGSELLISLLSVLVVIAIVAFTRRELAPVALITGPIVFLYFGIVSMIGSTIVINAVPLLLMAVMGIYRLFSFTYYRDI